MLLALLPALCSSLPCATNEILLRNRTCYCPFLLFNGQCLRRRYQTTVNTTLDSLYSTSRHLLSQQPMLLTVDASNAEAMQALAASLGNIRSIGTVVTRVVDAVDVLVGGDASATLEIVNVAVDKASSSLNLTVDFRFPLVDYFFLYMHLGSSAPPCPPFDPTNRCCQGNMGSASEFVTSNYVDCTSNDPFRALDQFVLLWSGVYLSDDRQTIQLTVPLSSVPSTVESAARVYRLGVGMVVFGKLAQNTEARVELMLNASSVATSYGAFQYSFVEYTRLQLEACGGSAFAHLVVKASGVQSIQNLRLQTWDAGDWIAPNCSNGTVMLGASRLMGCNVSIEPDFVDVYVSLKGISLANRTLAVYVLLQRGSVLARVVAKTDSTAIDRCAVPVTINATGHDAFTLEVAQGNRMLYSGPVQLVPLVDVAALTLTIVPQSALYAYAFDNISVVYSLVDSARILALMPDGAITPELERLCDSGNICLIEELLRGGVCQTGEKCEVQGASLFLMPLYPWGGATLTGGTYTVMVAEIRETLLQGGSSPVAQNSSAAAGGGIVRRLLSWVGL